MSMVLKDHDLAYSVAHIFPTFGSAMSGVYVFRGVTQECGLRPRTASDSMGFEFRVPRALGGFHIKRI